MIDATQIKAGMEVADTAGRHVGTVDHVEGEEVVLSHEGFADTLHHIFTLAAVTQVEGGRVTIEPGTVSSEEEVVRAHEHARRAGASGPFGTSGAGTGMGGSGRGEY